jgi:hypothetical protein
LKGSALLCAAAGLTAIAAAPMPASGQSVMGSQMGVPVRRHHVRIYHMRRHNVRVRPMRRHHVRIHHVRMHRIMPAQTRTFSLAPMSTQPRSRMNSTRPNAMGGAAAPSASPNTRTSAPASGPRPGTKNPGGGAQPSTVNSVTDTSAPSR